MTPADRYRVKAGDMAAIAQAEADPFQKAEYERLKLSYLRLAEQADRNSMIDLVYETPLAPKPQQHVQQQQQARPQLKKAGE